VTLCDCQRLTHCEIPPRVQRSCLPFSNWEYYDTVEPVSDAVVLVYAVRAGIPVIVISTISSRDIIEDVLRTPLSDE
jgi:hypothetical protein